MLRVEPLGAQHLLLMLSFAAFEVAQPVLQTYPVYCSSSNTSDVLSALGTRSTAHYGFHFKVSLERYLQDINVWSDRRGEGQNPFCC
jgi:hypothetical protein